jgi:cytidyltransferase-like protein
MRKGVIVSGYFNPLHKGHIEYLKLSKKKGDFLIVIVNNDFQRELKGSKKFMDETERKLIISELNVVDKVYLSIDKDRSVSKTIQMIYSELKNEFELFFTNGGDQDNSSILESKVCKELDIKMIDGIGLKIQSSSWLLKNNNF